MPDNAKTDLSDNLIREALRQEINCVEAPPGDRVWKNIATSLDKSRPSLKRRSFNWSRAAVVAAACLVIVLGGIGIFRNLDMSLPIADPGFAPEAADEVGVLDVESEAGQIEALDEDKARDVVDYGLPFGEADSMPPDWPLTLPGNYNLGETLLLTEAGEPLYRGAIYYNGTNDLLLVKEKNANKDLFVFINHLGTHMQLVLKDLKETNGFVRFNAGELPGLAWQDNGRNQALVVLSGQVMQGELKNIASAIE